LTKMLAGKISASTGGTVSAQGVTVELAPGSVVTGDNTPHIGKVHVFIANIDPTDSNFSQIMPGNLIAVQDNQTRGLTSFGMVGVELRNYRGQQLRLAQGQTATVRFPIATDLHKAAPSTIDLWVFDELNGYWKQEGQATRNGNEYVAQVGHFSFWNCDEPWGMVLLEGALFHPGNQPIQGATVTISGSDVGSASDITNDLGHFGGYVPANIPLNISVNIGCGSGKSTVYSANIGALTSNTTLQPISINPQAITMVTGSIVDCNNSIRPNSYVVANNQVYFARDGHFSFQVCGGSLTVTPYSTSPWWLGSAQTITLNGGTVSMGNLQVCGGGSTTGSVTDIDGNTYSTVIIGAREWMAENLKVSKYNNGNPISTNLSEMQWQVTTQGAYAYYDNDSVNNSIYGKLYNGYAVADPRSLCPTGWHVPTSNEWDNLVMTLDPQAIFSGWPLSTIAGGFIKDVGTVEAGTGLWWDPNSGATNSTGFTGLPGGYRYSSGPFNYIHHSGWWWTSTQPVSNEAWCRVFTHYDTNLYRYLLSKRDGMSVRCVKD